MTRIEFIREHLRQFGPKTTKELAVVAGWPLGTTSSVVSHARSYGYIEEHGKIPSLKQPQPPQTIWRAKEARA